MAVRQSLASQTSSESRRVNMLEQQAALPITNPSEMGSASIGDAMSRITGDKDYQAQFMHAFDREVNEQDMLSAIAAYERTWLPSILPSTISSPETPMPSATRPSAVRNCSTGRLVATSATL
jgi:di-heme cytochrome c peroxidase